MTAPAPAPRSGERPHDDTPDEPPGVPGFRSWPAVYAFIFGMFILLVIALTVFSRAYA
jgi:hypothetical protein